MRTEIKLVAMDIDGTLLGSTKKLTNYTRKVLKQAAQQGIHLVIASGRALKAVPEALLSIEGMGYIITSNGSSIFRLNDQKRVYGKDMTNKQVNAVMEFYDLYECPMEVFIGGEAYASKLYYEHPEQFGASASAAEYVRTTRKPVDDICAFIRLNCHNIEGINFIVDDPKLKATMRGQLEQMEGIYVTSSVPRYIEVSHGDVCKRNAIQWLAEYLNVNQEEIAAFGDGENDIEMLQYAGIGVAMENGVDSLKCIADKIAPSVENDGVARIIEEFFIENSQNF